MCLSTYPVLLQIIWSHTPYSTQVSSMQKKRRVQYSFVTENDILIGHAKGHQANSLLWRIDWKQSQALWPTGGLITSSNGHVVCCSSLLPVNLKDSMALDGKSCIWLLDSFTETEPSWVAGNNYLLFLIHVALPNFAWNIEDQMCMQDLSPSFCLCIKSNSRNASCQRPPAAQALMAEL